MKRFVVEVEVLGRRQTRLVPAKDEHTARRNCTTAESKVISCVPYTGQKLNLSSQEEIALERLFRGCLAANRRRKGGWNMAAATVAESIERKKARAEEANVLIEGLDEVTQKAVYIATKMFLAQRDTEEGKVAKK